MGLFRPDGFLTSLDKVDLAELRSAGKRCLLLDMDNTIRPRDTGVVPDAVLSWLDRARGMGFKICVVSNNWHDSVFHAAAALGLDVVHKAMKPLPFAFLRALRKTGCKRREAVAIGDELLTDVLGARLCHMRCVLVVPQSQKDIRFTKLIRKVEHVLMGDMQPR